MKKAYPLHLLRNGQSKNNIGNLFFIKVIFFLLFTLNLMGYEVKFEGVSDQKILDLIHSASQLEKLKENPPATLLGLRRRAEGDVTNIIQALHSLAYYGAKVDFNITNDGNLVIVTIHPGPIYPLNKVEIKYTQNGKPFPEMEKNICLSDLKIELNQPALPATILTAEELLLDNLNLQGYAFAAIKNRDVLINQKELNVIVIFEVETGPLTYFGPITISGEERVKEKFIRKKIQWKEGEIYDPRKVEKTEEALELTGLFKSVTLSHTDEPVEGNLIPFKIMVVEAKQRSIGFGVNYNTELGAGITGEWEDRNFRGEAQKLSLRADIWQIRQEGRMTYVVPEFIESNQSLIWALDYHHDNIKAYIDSTFYLSGTIEKKLSDRLRFSYGGMYKYIRSRHSFFNGSFYLFQTPVQLRWSNVDSILEPTKGLNIGLKLIPSIEFVNPRFAYCINTFNISMYQALTKNKRHILASKFMFGTILGASRNEIPPPERFLAGSESTLRGYHYLTVSPLAEHHKPIGGRSMLIYSLELRNRIGKNFGLVGFYDIGNVYFDAFPNFKHHFLQSVGVGIRYYTPIGPLRLDVAFPLNRRPHLDGPAQIYFSIGQAF